MYLKRVYQGLRGGWVSKTLNPRMGEFLTKARTDGSLFRPIKMGRRSFGYAFVTETTRMSKVPVVPSLVPLMCR